MADDEANDATLLVALLSGGYIDAANRDGQGNTILHHICTFQPIDLDFLARLINIGVPVDARNDVGSTALISASAASEVDAVRMLLQAGADPNAFNAKGITPLHAAAKGGCLQAVEVLMAAGASPMRTTFGGGFTPLHVATFFKRLDIINHLLLYFPQLFYVQDGKDRTARDVALETGAIDVLKAMEVFKATTLRGLEDTGAVEEIPKVDQDGFDEAVLEGSHDRLELSAPETSIEAPSSRSSSRPNSRPGSQPGSRPGSRSQSPPSASSRASGQPDLSTRPTLTRRISDRELDKPSKRLSLGFFRRGSTKRNKSSPEPVAVEPPTVDDETIEGSQRHKKCGWLQKQGGRRKTWKRRWFRLEKNYLSYFEAEDDEEAKGNLILTGCRIRRHTKTDNALEIYRPDGEAIVGNHVTFVIKAESEKAMQDWSFAIMQACTITS